MERKSETRTLQQQKKKEGRSFSEKAFLFLVGLWILQMLYHYPLMPGSMASHFDISGKANGWMSREGFFLLSFGTLVMFVLLFLVLPRSLHFFPDSFINMPNKAHWLAPERRAGTFARVRDRVLALGSATAILMVVLFQLVLQANLAGSSMASDVMWVLLGVYVAFSAIWCVLFVRSFRMPKGSTHQP